MTKYVSSLFNFFSRLHRILRNLCYHAPTREWVIKSLLSILEKSNDKQSLSETSSSACSAGAMLQNEMPIPAKIRKNKSSTFSTDLAAAAASKSEQPQKSAPSWLTISMDAALGFRANVFQVTRVHGVVGKF